MVRDGLIQLLGRLVGPPGRGKTTLALVAAAHAGFSTLEINASSDRAAGPLRERITEAARYADGDMTLSSIRTGVASCTGETREG